MIVDFHTHLQDLKAEEEEIKKMLKEVTPFISGYSHKGNVRAIGLAEKLELPYYIGLAPQEAQRMSYEEIDSAIDFVRKNSFYAIGEIGMDFHWAENEEHRKKQLYAFEKQLDIAEELSLPVVIHSRKAEEFIVELLIGREFPERVAFHFYAGKLSTALKAMDELDAYFSIIVFPSKERKKLLLNVELERILVETDAPYVGKSPLDVVKSIEYVSRIKGVEPKTVEKQTSLNAFNFIK